MEVNYKFVAFDAIKEVIKENSEKLLTVMKCFLVFPETPIIL